MAYAIQLNEGTEKEVKKLLQDAGRWIQMMREGRGKAEGKLQDGNEFEEFRETFRRFALTQRFRNAR